MKIKDREKLLNAFIRWAEFNFEDPRINFVFGKLVDEMNKLCDECQSDRLRCTFDPMCEDRKWLSLLIEAGVPRALWPKFCFSRRGEEVKNFLYAKTTPTALEDSKFPLKDFISLFLKKITKIDYSDMENYLKQIIQLIEKKWDYIDLISLSSGKYVLIFNKHEKVVIINVNRELVTINAKKTGFDNVNEFFEFLHKYLDSIQIEHKIVMPYNGVYFIYLFIDGGNMKLEDISSLGLEVWSGDNRTTLVYRYELNRKYDPLWIYEIDKFLDLMKLIKR